VTENNYVGKSNVLPPFVRSLEELSNNALPFGAKAEY
jgi:hypothetical protein